MGKDEPKYPSDLSERFQVRMPPGMRDQIKAMAERHGRSMNAEIVAAISFYFAYDSETDIFNLSEITPSAQAQERLKFEYIVSELRTILAEAEHADTPADDDRPEDPPRVRQRKRRPRTDDE